jgi:hypothetical protein
MQLLGLAAFRACLFLGWLTCTCCRIALSCSRVGGGCAGCAASRVAHSQSMHALTVAPAVTQGMHVLTWGVPYTDTTHTATA